MITGANGFIGINLTKKFVELGFSPLVLVRGKTIHNEILKIKEQGFNLCCRFISCSKNKKNN